MEETVIESFTTPNDEISNEANHVHENHTKHYEDGSDMKNEDVRNIPNSERSYIKELCCVVSFGLLFRIFGCFQYCMDVVTDVVTGATFIRGKPIDHSLFGKENFSNYTEDVCNRFESFSHPIWGSLVIALTWTPALALLPPLFVRWWNFYCGKWNSPKTDAAAYSWTKTIFISLTFILLWPFSGIVM